MADAQMAPESAAPPVPSPDWTGTVTFVSGDGDSFEVDSRVAEAALAVKRFLVDKDEEDEPTCQFPVGKVDTVTLKKTIEYMQRLNETRTKEAAGTPFTEEEVKAWDNGYLKMDVQPDMFKLLLAGNFLDMPELLEFLCIDLARQMRGKNPDQLRELFKVENDFSEEERREIENEPKWDFD